MREYGGDIHFICVEAQTLANKQSSFKAFFITQLFYSLCLATVTFIIGVIYW